MELVRNHQGEEFEVHNTKTSCNCYQIKIVKGGKERQINLMKTANLNSPFDR